MSGNRAVRESFGDRLLLICIYAFLSLILLIVSYPLIYIVSSSFSSPSAVLSGSVWLFPVEPTLKGYESIFKSTMLMRGFGNSVFYTAVGTLINVSLTILIAYPLAKKTFYGRHAIMIILLITMFFDGGLIPTYLLVKQLHLMDTPWAMWLPSAFSVFQVIIARTFFQTSIPDDLAEAAALDGCRDTRFLVSIVLPLSKPIVAVMALMYAVGHWNAYFDALIYLRSERWFPLQYVLRNILILNSSDPTMLSSKAKLLEDRGFTQLLKYGLIVVASIPIIIVYPFVQKHFVKGVMIGSLKG